MLHEHRKIMSSIMKIFSEQIDFFSRRRFCYSREELAEIYAKKEHLLKVIDALDELIGAYKPKK